MQSARCKVLKWVSLRKCVQTTCSWRLHSTTCLAEYADRISIWRTGWPRRMWAMCLHLRASATLRILGHYIKLVLCEYTFYADCVCRDPSTIAVRRCTPNLRTLLRYCCTLYMFLEAYQIGTLCCNITSWYLIRLAPRSGYAVPKPLDLLVLRYQEGIYSGFSTTVPMVMSRIVLKWIKSKCIMVLIETERRP